LEVEAAKQEQTDQQERTEGADTDRSNKIGTYVFGAFSIIALLVSIVKGIVPYYLLESAVWAGAAWYWHEKKTHSELAKAVVIVLAALIAVGEAIQIASAFRSESPRTLASTANPIDSAFTSRSPSTYPSPVPASAGALPAPDFAEIEQEAVALYKQKRYANARPLFDQACNDGEMKACNYLGYLYAQGLGGPHDRKKAQDVYQRACDQETLSSCASLGSLYQDAGDGDNARKYFRKACNGGVAEACDLLRSLQ
jgi:tetratricopeptide (TPR) repeat protein